jgi:hypothetical protein
LRLINAGLSFFNSFFRFFSFSTAEISFSHDNPLFKDLLYDFSRPSLANVFAPVKQ